MEEKKVEDTLTSNLGEDTLAGGEDTVAGGDSGADTVSGGEGEDTTTGGVAA